MSSAVPKAPTPVERTMEQRVARRFGLEGDAWTRHANQLSVWTRFSCLSLIALAVWSRDWIGWYCLIAVMVATVWTVVNPRLFRVPASTSNWVSKSVFGERIWANRRSVDIPRQFQSRVPNLANAYSCIGLAFLTYGLVALNVWFVVAGIVVVHGGKLWFLDRIVLLFEDMNQHHPDYATWSYES
jgi:hypothetical protein